MNQQLTVTEIQQLQANLSEYAPVQEALTTLATEDGNLEASFNKLWQEKKQQTPPIMPEGKSLWQVTLKVLREELCGEEGFQAKVKQYLKNPKSAGAFSAIVGYLVGIAALEPAIASIIVLYILKVGLNIFCEYTQTNEEMPN